jgi:hypothetical protein
LLSNTSRGGENTVRKTLKICSFILISLFAIGFCNIQGISAKSANVPSGASDVIYQCGEGVAVINLPSTLPTNYPPTATKMLIGVHIDSAPAKYAGIRLYVELWEIMPGDTEYEWQPWVEITTNANSQTLMKQFWGGCATEFNLAAATTYCSVYGIPTEFAPLLTTDNVLLVSKHVLTAFRCGDDVYIRLNAPQQIKQPMTTDTYWTLPALCLKLDGYGHSIHKETTITMSGWPGAWGGTFVTTQMGFNAAGTCTIPAWGYFNVKVSDGWISMNAKQTFYPPT